MTCLPEESDDCIGNDMTYFTHRTIINVRDEDVPIFAKSEKSHINVRSFNKDNSVFREWKQDTPDDALACIEHDLEHWYIKKLIKKDEQLDELCDMIRKYAKELKNLYIMVASRSKYPQVSELDFSQWAKESHVIDSKETQTAVDLAFTAVTRQQEGEKEIPGRDAQSLMRYKFLELLVRVSDGKYKDIKNANSADCYAVLFEKLLKEVILEHAPYEPM